MKFSKITYIVLSVFTISNNGLASGSSIGLDDINSHVNFSLNGTFFGLYIENLDKSSIKPKHLFALQAQKNDRQFQRKMVGRLDDEKQVLAAYVILNSLYPEKGIYISSRPFPVGSPEIGIPISIDSRGKLLPLNISKEEFGRIVKKHWEMQLHIKSKK